MNVLHVPYSLDRGSGLVPAWILDRRKCVKGGAPWVLGPAEVDLEDSRTDNGSSRGQILALTVLDVPISLDVG